MKQRIVILGPAHPYRGGIAAYNERLARELQSMGHEVKIFSFTVQYPSFLFPGKTQFSSSVKPVDLDIERKINSINPFNWISVGNELKKMKPDVIMVRYWLPFMGPCLGTILRRVKKNHHTQIVCIADNILPHEKRIGDEAFTAYFVKPIDRFIVMSDKVLNDLKKFDRQKPVQLIPHPLYDHFGEIISKAEAREKLGMINSEWKILLFFGFIRKYKGLDMLIDALKIINSQSPQISNLKLIIAGEFYEDEEKYKQQIAAAGLQDMIILKNDFIPDAEVKYYLCAADCVVQPYRNATQSGVTPLAYHFEKPMIVTNVGGLPDLVPDEQVGLVCEPEAASIAGAIRKFYTIGEAHFIPFIKEEKKKYSWRRMAEAVMSS